MTLRVLTRLLCLAPLLVAAAPAIASTPAGTVLYNQAQATYFDPLSGTVERRLSNVSQVMVGAVRAVSLEADTNLPVTAGQTINLSHVLTNTGNLFDHYRLTVINLAGGSTDLISPTIFLDTNGNGKVDPGEPELSESPPLMAGENVMLVVTGTVPGAVVNGDQIRLHVHAVSAQDANVEDSVRDTLHVGSGAHITLTKSASQACSAPLSPGDTLRYTIGYTNIGNAAPTPRTILVEGQPWDGVLVEDRLPGNLSLMPSEVTGLSPIQAVPLVHRAGDPEDQWQRYDQWQADYAPDRFAVWVPAANMAPNHSGGFSFAVRLNQAVTAGTTLLNTASVDLDGDGLAEFTSNQVCNTVRGNTLPEISFLRPSAAVIQRDGWPAHGVDADFERADMYALIPETAQNLLQDGVYVQLDAAQLNRAPGAPDTLEYTASGERLILVQLGSRLTGDSVQVVMRETAANTGRFRSIHPVLLSEMRSGGGAVCPASATLTQQPLYHGGTVTSDAIAQRCVLRSSPGDRLTARYTVAMAASGGTRQQVITAAAAVDPAGLVFDASNGRALGGAQVLLYQSRQALAQYGAASSCNALPATEYQRARHPVTGAELPPVATGDGENMAAGGLGAGQYRYPYLAAGHCYYLDVVPPSGFTFPSAVAPEAARMFHANVTDSSYGQYGYQIAAGRSTSLRGAFLPSAGNLFVNIPLDPASTVTAGQLVLTKEVEQASAAVGDVIRYRVSVSSGHNAPLYAGQIIDSLPYGFRYVPRSAWLEVDGKRINIPEPTGAAEQKIFALQQRHADGRVTDLPLQPGAQVTLHYALRLSAGAVDSNGLNRAVAQARTVSGFVYRSNEDQVRVSVRSEGVLSDKAMLFGKIYVDSNCDNLQSDGEWPIGGVKLYMQDGSWVITDENGQYSIYGLDPGLHTIKVDPLTLPDGVRLKPIDNRHAADPGSRFVDLVPGEYHRADFAAVCPEPHQASALFEALQARNQSIDGAWMLDEAARFDPMRSNTGNSAQRQAGRDGDLGSGLYTSGSTGGHTINDTWQRIAQPAPVATQDEDQPAALAREAMPPTEEAVEQITRQQGVDGTWLWPRGGISRDGRFQVVVRAGLAPVLTVNGEPVPSSQLGEQILNRSEQAEVLSWYGVPLREGRNQLQVVATDGFGNQRVLASGEFVRPGSSIRALHLLPETDQFSADGGRSVVPVRVLLLDGEGYPVSGVQFVTLENEMGQWVEPDIQPDTAGHQVRVQDGEALVHLRSTEYTGTLRLRARLEQLTAQARVEQVAPMRPLVATGFMQLRGNVSHVDDNGNAPGNLALDDEGIDGRAAVFIKGEVRGNAHLTLAYDTDKRLDEEDEVRRDLNPADYYPIPGGASVRGYDAQSRSKLYARLEKGRHSLMWGDYLTDSQQEFLDLGRVQRTVTGVNAVYDTGDTRIQLFGARPELEQMTEELRGNGTALLYRLSNRPSRNSESVEILVRDRNNSGLVLSSRALTRYVDYSVNYFTGDIRFHEVIPSLDDNFNPVFVRVHYNVEGDRDSYNFYGLRLQQQLTENVGIGLSSTHDEHALEGFDLHSIAAEYRVGERTRLHASAAHMGHENGDPQGSAVSFNAQHAWDGGSTTDLRWARAGEGFDNPAGGINEAREELRLAHRQQLGARLAITTEGMHSEQLDNDDQQTSLGLIAEQQFDRHALRVGARGIEQRDSTSDNRFGTWIVGATRNSSLFGKSLQIGADYEQAFSYSDRRRIAADADMQITGHTSLYSRYELIDSLAGVNNFSSDTQTRQFTFGVRSALTRNTDVFSEYRMRGAIDGSDVAAANGVRSDLEITPGLTVTPSLEWIETLQGGRSQDATAISVGMEDKRNENRRTLARVETRFGDGREYYGLSAANIWRLNSDWSAVVRDDLRLQFTHGQAKEGDNIVTFGLAHRPRRNNRHHMLYMYKWKEHWGGISGFDRTVHMFSTHHNYQAHDDWILSGRVGGKWQTTDLGTTTADTDAWVMDGRIIWDITRRFDLDIHGGMLATEGTDELRHSFGIGINALVRRNLRMGIGFNVVGFRDVDLDPEGYNAQGLYIGLEYKFDENDLGWLGSKAAGQRSYMGAPQ